MACGTGSSSARSWRVPGPVNHPPTPNAGTRGDPAGRRFGDRGGLPRAEGGPAQRHSRRPWRTPRAAARAPKMRDRGETCEPRATTWSGVEDNGPAHPLSAASAAPPAHPDPARRLRSGSPNKIIANAPPPQPEPPGVEPPPSSSRSDPTFSAFPTPSSSPISESSAPSSAARARSAASSASRSRPSPCAHPPAQANDRYVDGLDDPDARVGGQPLSVPRRGIDGGDCVGPGVAVTVVGEADPPMTVDGRDVADDDVGVGVRRD